MKPGEISKPALRTLRVFGGPADGTTVQLERSVSTHRHTVTKPVSTGWGLVNRETYFAYVVRKVTLSADDMETATYQEFILVPLGDALSDIEIRRRVLDRGLLLMQRPQEAMAEIEVDGSSVIARIGYAPKDRTLRVVIKNSDASRSIYHYADVPAEVFAEFLVAESKGQFFGRRVRSKYHSTRITQG